MRRLFPLTVLLATYLSSMAAADVLVVAPLGGGDYTSLQPAINAASNGDTILYRLSSPCPPCGSASATVNGKSLTIVGDPLVPGETVEPIPFLNVFNLAPGQQVVLRGLRIQGGSSSGAAGVYFESPAGHLWIEDCSIEGSNGDFDSHGCLAQFPAGGPALFAPWSGTVTVVRSTLLGGRGGDANPPSGVVSNGGDGALVAGSDVAFFECAIEGGRGGNGLVCGLAGNGGTGVNTLSSPVLFSGCTVTGGAPGSFGVGGVGVQGNIQATFELLDTAVSGGAGGVDFVTAPGAQTYYPGSARSFALDSPLREQQSGTLSLQGVQGDFVGFFWSFGSGALPMPSRNGWFVLDPSFLGGPFFIGFITDPGGTWDIPITAPLLLPAFEAQTFFLQAWFWFPGGVTLGSGTSLTVVDQAF